MNQISSDSLNLNSVQELEFKNQELSQSLEFLEGRVEELEQIESNLRMGLQV